MKEKKLCPYMSYRNKWASKIDCEGDKCMCYGVLSTFTDGDGKRAYVMGCKRVREDYA